MRPSPWDTHNPWLVSSNVKRLVAPLIRWHSVTQVRLRLSRSEWEIPPAGLTLPRWDRACEKQVATWQEMWTIPRRWECPRRQPARKRGTAVLQPHLNSANSHVCLEEKIPNFKEEHSLAKILITSLWDPKWRVQLGFTQIPQPQKLWENPNTNLSILWLQLFQLWHWEHFLSFDSHCVTRLWGMLFCFSF